MTDSYEDEVNELMVSGTGVIEGLKLEVNEALDKLQAQELVIMAYNAQMQKKDDDIDLLRENHKNQLAEIRERHENAVKRVDTHSDGIIDSVSQRKIDDMREDCERKLFDLQAQCNEKLEEQQRRSDREVII